MLQAFSLLALGLSQTSRSIAPSSANSADADYPWRFEGRLWFRPALVRLESSALPLPGGVRPLELFGWSLGGVVALQYDSSPFGAYREYVSMGALVTKRGALGQWGPRLYVSDEAIGRDCENVWGVPAIHADIRFDEGERRGESNGGPRVETAPPVAASGLPRIVVGGWRSTRHQGSGTAPTRGAVPILWTPQLKALWAPLVPLPEPEGTVDDDALRLHRLRLGASSLRLHYCDEGASEIVGVPLPLSISVEGLRIEIGPVCGRL